MPVEGTVYQDTDIYNSLEEIVQDMKIAWESYNAIMAVIWKLEKTIKNGSYLQIDGAK